MERHTIQKELVYSALIALRTHPTAEQVYARIHATHPRISKATVYRILRSMADKGEITRVPVANGADRYDFNRSTHFHICCDRCGRVADIFDPALDERIREAGGTSAFRLDRYELLFHGLCQECRSKAE